MTQSIPLSDLESTPSAKFAQIGDRASGRIVAMDERQQTNMQGKPLTFEDGSPRMQWVISILQDNGETVALYCKGGNYQAETGSGESMRTAIGIAVRDAQATGVDVGGELAIAFTGLGTKKPGQDAPKLYTAQYRAPAAPSIPAADLFSKPGES